MQIHTTKSIILILSFTVQHAYIHRYIHVVYLYYTIINHVYKESSFSSYKYIHTFNHGLVVCACLAGLVYISTISVYTYELVLTTLADILFVFIEIHSSI